MLNPHNVGTKAAHYSRSVEAGETVVLDPRLARRRAGETLESPLDGFSSLLQQRQEEADEFYDAVLPDTLPADAKLLSRQAYAGLLWSKQYYSYSVTDWLDGDPSQPPPPRSAARGGIVTGPTREW